MDAAENLEGVITCANPDCRVAETGKCVEGFAFDACNFYGKPAQALENLEVQVEDVPARGTELPSADALNLREASAALRTDQARVVAIIGPSDAGKTSLIASLYDLFQVAPIDGIYFGRTLSFHAFEQTCHDARAASRRDTPHMNRTPLGEVRFYHLELGLPNEHRKMMLLMGDRAGEDYRTAADEISLARGFAEIYRADCIAVLVDGERLMDSGKRHNVRSEVKLIIQALIDGEAIENRKRLAFILTKADLIENSEHKERIINDFDALTDDARTLFSNSFSEIESFIVAASPKIGRLRRGDGIAQLLKFWLARAQSPHPTSIITPRSPRAFSNLRMKEEH